MISLARYALRTLGALALLLLASPWLLWMACTSRLGTARVRYAALDAGDKFGMLTDFYCAAGLVGCLGMLLLIFAVHAWIALFL